jgi:hypothetical protein
MIKVEGRARLLGVWETERVKVVSAKSQAHQDNPRQARWLNVKEGLLQRSWWLMADLEREGLIEEQAAKKAKKSAETMSPVGQPAPKSKASRNLHAADEPFWQEMHALINTGKAKSALDAAKQVAPRAVGNSLPSTIDRLRKGYKNWRVGALKN